VTKFEFSFLLNARPKNAIATNAELVSAVHHLPGGSIERAGETPGFPGGRHPREVIAEYPYITFDDDFRTGETARPCTQRLQQARMHGSQPYPGWDGAHSTNGKNPAGHINGILRGFSEGFQQ
jgi:hypothetical protein